MADPFGIYLHWPFCLSKCPYCDFNSHVAATPVDHDAWRSAFLAELARYAGQTGGRTVTSVFFGGGTPSLMDPRTAGGLLEAVAGHWTMASDVEITLEANPGTAEADRFADFRAAGVNRLSVGLQSLDDRALRFLGRAHDAKQAIRAVELARKLFPRLSFDLMYALPGQSAADWQAELSRAIDLAADHLSLYQLTIERGTAFYGAYARGEFQLPDEDLAAQLFEQTAAMTEAAGLPAYEISNHAVAGAECRHNLIYWQGDDYLGIGPGAHGRLTMDGHADALQQHKAPERWLAAALRGDADSERNTIDPRDRQVELVMMGLRLSAGLSAVGFARRAGIPLATALDPAGLRRMIEDEFLVWAGDHLQTTPRGRLVLNAVLAAILP
jgi:oxygen-independent coproporphyrinogen-3 oxidase